VVSPCAGTCGAACNSQSSLPHFFFIWGWVLNLGLCTVLGIKPRTLLSALPLSHMSPEGTFEPPSGPGSCKSRVLDASRTERALSLASLCAVGMVVLQSWPWSFTGLPSPWGWLRAHVEYVTSAMWVDKGSGTWVAFHVTVPCFLFPTRSF
jgi:hypothetical protein